MELSPIVSDKANDRLITYQLRGLAPVWFQIFESILSIDWWKETQIWILIYKHAKIMAFNFITNVYYDKNIAAILSIKFERLAFFT